jgi:hypothetical protein
VYSGPLCYGPSRTEPARCFRAQLTVFDGKITGEWAGRDDGVTFKASGEVSPAGTVKIDIHGEDAAGTRTATINLTGAIENERLDATGSFRTGRRVYLSWRRN